MKTLERTEIINPQKTIDLSFAISPRSVTIVNGKMFFVDEYAHKLFVTDNYGKVLNSFGQKGSGRDDFFYPTCVCADDENTLWITDRWNHRIKRLSVDGKTLLSVGGYGSEKDKFSEPTGIQYYSGHIYVADRNNHRVRIFDKKGDFIRCFGIKGADKEYFEGDEFKKGYIFQSWFVMAAKFLTPDTFFHKEGNVIGNMEYPAALAVSENGEIIVVDSASDRLKWFSNNGNLIGGVEPENLSVPFEFISGITFLDNEKCIMTTELNDKAVVLNKNSDIICLLSYPAGRLNFPYCEGNTVWILDNWNKQLHKFSLK